jgi:hypothetical protein
VIFLTVNGIGRDGKPFPISVPIKFWFIIFNSLVYHLLFSFKNRHFYDSSRNDALR